MSRQRGAKAQTQKRVAAQMVENTIPFNSESKQRQRRIDLIPRTRNQETLVMALQDPATHIVVTVGPAGTGKTTAMIEAAVSAQKMKVLPVFIITEMKWNWEHATQMGLQVKEIADEETGL